MAKPTFILRQFLSKAGGTADMTFAAATGATDGDRQLLAVACFNGMSITTPSGWTLLGTYNTTTFTRLTLFTRPLNTTTAAAGFTIPSVADYAAAEVRTFRGAVGISVVASGAGATTNTAAVSSVSTLVHYWSASFDNNQGQQSGAISAAAGLEESTTPYNMAWFNGLVGGNDPTAPDLTAPARTATKPATASIQWATVKVLGTPDVAVTLVQKIDALAARIRTQFNSLTLNKLADVDTVTNPPSQGQALIYDANGLTWKPGTVSTSGGGGGGGSALSGVKLRTAGGQSVPTNTFTPMTWELEDWDTDGYHSTTTNTSRITIPTGKAGKYLVHARFHHEAGSSGHYIIDILKNNTGIALESTWTRGNPGQSPGMFTTSVLDLAEGDYIEARYYGPSATLGARAEFSAILLSGSVNPATAKRFWFSTMSNVVVNPVPAASTLIPGMTLTIPSSPITRVAFIDTTVVHTGTHTNRVHIAVDGVQQTAEVTGNLTGANTMYDVGLTRVPVELAAGSAHTIEVKWNASDSTASVTLIQRTLVADIVEGSISSATTGLALAAGAPTPTLQTYTPVITAQTTNPTLGTGAVQFGRYTDNGLYVEGDIFIRAGTGFTAGTGYYKFSVPVNVHADDIANNLRAGSGHFYDVSTNNTYDMAVAAFDATTLVAYVNAGTVHGATVPATPVATDEWRFQFRYRKA